MYTCIFMYTVQISKKINGWYLEPHWCVTTKTDGAKWYQGHTNPQPQLLQFFFVLFCSVLFCIHWTLHNHIYNIQMEVLLVPSLCGKQVSGGNALTSKRACPAKPISFFLYLVGDKQTVLLTQSRKLSPDCWCTNSWLTWTLVEPLECYASLAARRIMPYFNTSARHKGERVAGYFGMPCLLWPEMLLTVMQREVNYLLSHLHHPTPIPLTLRREHIW